MASPAAGSRATKAGPRAWPAATGVPRQLSAPGSIPASAPRGRGRPARRRRFLHHVRIFRARPLLQLCPAPRGAPGRRLCRQRAVGQGQQFLDAQVEHIVGRGQAAEAGAAFAQRQRAAPGGGDVADQHAARGLALAAVQPRAGDQQPRQRPLPARQRRVQRPPGRKRGGLLARTQRGRVGADQVQHAVQQIIRRFAPARMTQIGFVDGAMAVALQEVREGAAKRAVWRQRVAPVRAAPVGCAQPGQRRRIVARQRGQIHQRVALGGRHAGRAASHERGGQRVALARAGRLDQFQQFRQGAAGRALQEEQVVGGQQRGELLAQPSAQRRGVLGQGFPAQARARAACRGSPVLAASRMGMARRL